MSHTPQHAQQLDIMTKILATTLQKNLLSLEKYMPSAYEAFKNYKEKHIFLTIDDDQNINLVKDGTLIYPTDPKAEIATQLKKFTQSPRHFNYRPNITCGKPITSATFLQQHHLLEIEKLRLSDPHFVAKTASLPQCVPFLSIIGVGLGYHLEALVNDYEIQHLYVFEPEADIFYCFLHIIDLEPIFQKCTQGSRTISFKIGDNAQGFMNFYPEFFRDQGHFLSCRHYFYRHYHSDKIDEAFVMLHDLIHRTLQGWGFYEDELIGLAHTLLNFQHSYPLLANRQYVPSPELNAPVIIVGNGPSLDDSIADIKRCQGNAIIFSCGSALMALYNAGITPDYHIEVERAVTVDNWLAAINDAAYLKQINCICLNNVHPNVAQRFKNTIMVLKPNDVGALLAREILSSHIPENLIHSNPTVVNGAVASAIALGFKEMYLFGVDMGFKNKDHHHSKNSGYYTNEKFKTEAPDTYSYPGNFCEEVQTTQDYDFSRFQIEHVLQKNPDVKCFNCSDGVKIALTTPLRSQAINSENADGRKQTVLNKIQHEHVYSISDDIAQKMEARFFDHFSTIKNLLHAILQTIAIPPKSFEQMLTIFSEQCKMVLKFRFECPILFIMCSGTITYLQAETTTFAYDYENEKDAMKFVAKAFDVWQQHIHSMLKLTEDHYKSTDDSYSPYDYFDVRQSLKNSESAYV
jgi:hypothetical protein